MLCFPLADKSAKDKAPKENQVRLFDCKMTFVVIHKVAEKVVLIINFQN